MPFSLLSGLTTPVSNMPRVLQYFTAINPLRYAIDIARRVYLEGAGLRSAVARSVAAGADRRRHAERGLVDVRPSHDLRFR